MIIFLKFKSDYDNIWPMFLREFFIMPVVKVNVFLLTVRSFVTQSFHFFDFVSYHSLPTLPRLQTL